VDKRLIQQAVEWVFKVKVDVVRVANVKGKPRRFKQTSGRHNHWKKAYITLKPGYNIDLTSWYMAAFKKINPTSPGRRFVVQPSRAGVHRGKPWASLLAPKPKTGGRNNQGRISVRHQGGGHKRQYRLVDFKRNKAVTGCVERIEYDPNRSAYLALVLYQDGQRSYIIAPHGLSKGSTVVSGLDAPIKPGNCLPLRHIPPGTVLHAVELKPGKGAQLALAAGTCVTLSARDASYAKLRLPSSEIKRVPVECKASIGVVSNTEHNLRALGKAGAKRWRGIRPTVRGVAMNPVDHPMGGGEGKSSGGRHPVSPWGMPTKGFKTRRNKRTDRSIMERRKQ
jgi:large subunit ribosomal protein L2